MIDMAGERQVGRNNRKNGIAKVQECVSRAQDVCLDMDMKTICICGGLRIRVGRAGARARAIGVPEYASEKRSKLAPAASVPSR
jgi:hypothetical protein